MIRRIFAALMLAVLLCSGAYGATWIEDAEQWFEGALQSTKDFFTDDIPSFFTRSAEYIAEWWNNSDSKRLESIEERLERIEGLLLAEKERAIAERERTLESQYAQYAAAKKEKEFSSRDAELNRRYEEVTAREIELSKDLARVYEFDSRRRESEDKAAKIFACLSGDENTRNFLQAGMLAKMDTVKFMATDKSYGALDIRNTPYGELTVNLDTDKFGFINPGSLKNSLKNLFRDNTFSLRGDSVVLVLSGDKSDWNKQIDSLSGGAFFTIEGLSSELDSLTHSAGTAESEIASFLMLNGLEGKLRVFFRTKHEGLYVLAVIDNYSLKPAIYLSADSSHKLIRKKDLQRALRNSTDSRNYGREAALYFDPNDSKIDVYLDKFINGLVRKIPGYKD